MNAKPTTTPGHIYALTGPRSIGAGDSLARCDMGTLSDIERLYPSLLAKVADDPECLRACDLDRLKDATPDALWEPFRNWLLTRCIPARSRAWLVTDEEGGHDDDDA